MNKPVWGVVPRRHSRVVRRAIRVGVSRSASDDGRHRERFGRQRDRDRLRRRRGGALAAAGQPDHFWAIVLPGMFLGIVVGYATQRYGSARTAGMPPMSTLVVRC